MKSKKFTKAGVGFIAIFAILLTVTGLMMTACQSTVNPSSPGIATVTKTFTPTATIPVPTNTPSNVPINAGDIAFIGIVTSAGNQFAFVTLNTIPASAQINFTNYPFDQTLQQFVTTGTTSGRGVIQWAVPTATVVPYTEIYVTANTAAASVVGGGAVPNFTGSFSLNSGEDQIYCYQGTLANPTTFVSAIGVYTGTSNYEPQPWLTTAITANAPSTGPWAGLPTNLLTGSGTTVCYNAFNDTSSAKTFRDWVYQCSDGTPNDTEANINASINNNGTGAVTVYYPAGTANNLTQSAYSTYTTGGTAANQALSIISGNSMGTSFASTNATFPQTAGVSFGICNQNYGATTSGYPW